MIEKIINAKDFISLDLDSMKEGELMNTDFKNCKYKIISVINVEDYEYPIAILQTIYNKTIYFIEIETNDIVHSDITLGEMFGMSHNLFHISKIILDTDKEYNKYKSLFN